MVELSKKEKIKKIINGRILMNHQFVEDYLFIKDGKFIDGSEYFWNNELYITEIIDARGSLVVPGYIDLQLNAQSKDLQKCLNEVSKKLCKQGVTSYCPTLVSSNKEVYNEIYNCEVPRKGNSVQGAEILGFHFEGPFINKEKKGAHDINTFSNTSNGISDLLTRYCINKNRFDMISIITLAPELDGVIDIIEELSSKIPVAKMITHIFNAMGAFHHRDPGIIGLLGSTNVKRPFYGLICDGIHANSNSVKIAYYSNPKGVVLVTDAMAAMGLDLGEYKLGNMEVIVSNKGVHIKDTNIIAGCSNVAAIEAATLHPALCLGIDKVKGSLNNGNDADFLFLNDDLGVLETYIRGEKVDFDN